MSIDDRYWVRHDDDTVSGLAWGRPTIFMRVHEILPQGDDPVRPERLLTDAEKQQFISLFLTSANRMGDPPMSRQQRAVLNAVRAYVAETSFFPGRQTISDASGVPLGTVVYALKTLTDIGVLESDPGQPWSAARLRLPRPRTAEDHVKAPAS